MHRNTEVEEQSVGGDRHDVRAYIGVRQLIPRGPATRPGPFPVYRWRRFSLQPGSAVTGVVDTTGGPGGFSPATGHGPGLQRPTIVHSRAPTVRSKDEPVPWP